MPMTDSELVAILNNGVENAVIYSGTYKNKQEDQLKYYKSEPFGDEVEGRSQAIKSDVADVVDADMVSLTRVLLGARNIIKFAPQGISQEAVAEAEQKTKYINYLIGQKAGGFEKLFKWIKGAEIYDYSVMKYFIEEREESEKHSFKGINSEELQSFMDGISQDAEVVITSSTDPDDEGRYDVSLSVKVKSNELVLHHVPPESFLMSRNTEDYKKAEFIGDRDTTKTRGDLVAEGYDKALVAQLPALSIDADTQGTITQVRFDDEGGVIIDDYMQWATERVEVYNVFPLIDYDGDGVAERRSVIYAGNTILSNEPYGFDIPPYAPLTAYPEPHKAIGEARASKVMQTQRINSVVMRQGLDNLYQVNNPKTLINEKVDQDELLGSPFGGYVTVEDDGIPAQSYAPMIVPPVYEGALTMLQWMDQSRAQTTGSLMASQGLEADAVADETATRFKGLERSSAGKVELLARIYTETGFKDLYEGVANIVNRYQDADLEILITGEELKFRPTDWKYKNVCTAQSGLALGDKDTAINTLTGILSIQRQLKQEQSPLVDNKDIYNTLDNIVQTSDLPSTEEFFNDPSAPDQLIAAENELLKGQLLQMQQALQQMQNPLQQAEETRAKASLIEAQAKQQTDAAKIQADMQKSMLKMRQENEQFNAKMQADMQKLMIELAAAKQKQDANTALQLTKLDMQDGDNQGQDAKETYEQND